MLQAQPPSDEEMNKKHTRILRSINRMLSTSVSANCNAAMNLKPHPPSRAFRLVLALSQDSKTNATLKMGYKLKMT